MNNPQQETPRPVWCVVANIVHERRYGPGGLEIRRGTKQLGPGAKVYVIDFFWGMGGEDVTVVGRHRRSHRYITITIRTAWLVNWRVELVYSPYVIQRRIEHPWAYHPPLPAPEKEPQEWFSSPAAKAAAEQLIRNVQQGHPSTTQTQPFGTRPSQSSDPQE